MPVTGSKRTADGGDYLVFTSAGLWATYAVLGVKNKQTGEFSPYLMGIHRGITTSPDNPAVIARLADAALSGAIDVRRHAGRRGGCRR